LATHAQKLDAGKFRRAKTVTTGVVVTLGIALLGAASAQAAPSTPTTSDGAKAAWHRSSHQAEIAAEQVNGAREAQAKAQQADKKAVAGLSAANQRAAATKAALAAASSTVAGYQVKLDAFANASFQGASLSQLSVILTATSADDYLDESTVVNKVAEDTHNTLDQAIGAKRAAATAKAQADSAATTAATAKTHADSAAAAATAATATAQQKKADLDAAVANYRALYNKLSAKEKAAAAAAAEAARQRSLAAAAKAEAEAQAAVDAAAAAQAAAEAESSQAQDSPVAPAAPAASDTSSASPSSSSSSSTSSSASSAEKSSAPAPVAQSGDSAGEIAAQAAMTKIGNPYTYAGNGPEAFDCSGLTTWAWSQAGVGIPRASYEQANFPEVPLDQLQPGDLVTYYSPVSHVAIYVGNGMVVSAADEALGIVYVPVGRAGPDATGHRVPRG